MKSVVALSLFAWVVSAGIAPAAEGRNPTPDRVTILAQAGYLNPTGRFARHVDGGAMVGAGAFYRLTDYVCPAFGLRYAHLEPERGSVDRWDLVAGLRLFLLPRHIPVRPWLAAFGGWAHYRSSPNRLDLGPVIPFGRTTRNDPLLSLGGGLDVKLHPNFEIGVDVRHEVSFTDDRERGERDLQAVSILGSLIFNY